MSKKSHGACCMRKMAKSGGLGQAAAVFFSTVPIGLHFGYYRPPLSTLPKPSTLKIFTSNFFTMRYRSPLDFVTSLCYNAYTMKTYEFHNYDLILSKFTMERIVREMGFTEDRAIVCTVASDINIHFHHDEDVILFELLGGFSYVVNKAWDTVD